MSEPIETSDQRLLRGARSRKQVLRAAVDTASLDGLHGLSFGRLATDTGLSKAGIQTLFGTKQRLQLATAEHARQVFREAVISPALAHPAGVPRLRALVEEWIAYAEAPLFPGGCFWAANLAEFDSRPGPVRDALYQHQLGWRDLIATQLRHAVHSRQVATLEPDLVAFQIEAVLLAANTALQFGDITAADTVRRLVNGMLTPPPGPEATTSDATRSRPR